MQNQEFSDCSSGDCIRKAFVSLINHKKQTNKNLSMEILVQTVRLIKNSHFKP